MTTNLPIEIAVPENDAERDEYVRRVDYAQQTAHHAWHVYRCEDNAPKDRRHAFELASGLYPVIAMYASQIEAYETSKQAEAV